MLLLNPVYSWLASRKNLRGVLIGCYSFFISNLLGFIILLQFFDPSSSMSLGQILPEVFFYKWQFLDPALSISLSQIFYIWCNVYSFFVVSIFWVVIINLFRGENAANVFGVIAAGGSLGAYLGSEISKHLLKPIRRPMMRRKHYCKLPSPRSLPATTKKPKCGTKKSHPLHRKVPRQGRQMAPSAASILPASPLTSKVARSTAKHLI